MDVEDLDISSFDATLEAQLAIKNPLTNELTTWLWTFYGPGHPETVKLGNQLSREMMKEAREKEEARVNGRKWKGEDRSIEEVRTQNVGRIAQRVKFWTPIKLNGEMLEFSAEATRKLLLDPNKNWLLFQVNAFLLDDESFMQRAAS